MASSSDPSLMKRGREEDDDDSRRKKAKEEQEAKAAEKCDDKAAERRVAAEIIADNIWSGKMLRKAFTKLRGVATAFGVKAPDYPKGSTVRDFTFKIYGLAEELEKLPMVRDASGDDDDGGGEGDGAAGEDDDGSSGGTPGATTA